MRSGANLCHMQTIGVCGRKGGSGKTTTAVHLAAELASRKSSVLLIDCDPQGSAKHWSEPGQLPMEVQAIPIEGLSDVATLNAAVHKAEADYLVLDSPPHLDSALGAVIVLSDVAVIPCGPSGLDLIATAQTVALVQKMRGELRSPSPAICLVPNRVDTRTSSGRQLVGALEDLREDVGPAIHSRTALADSFNLGAWVGAYAPGSPAHTDVIALTDHVVKMLRKAARKKMA